MSRLFELLADYFAPLVILSWVLAIVWLLLAYGGDRSCP